MDWQVMLKLFILFLPMANPEILHIGKTALYDNTSPTWEIFSPEISVKIANVMTGWPLNLEFREIREKSGNLVLASKVRELSGNLRKSWPKSGKEN